MAALKDDVDTIKYLLSRDADANQANNAGVIPLYEAANSGSLASFKLLAAKTKPSNSTYSLHFACLSSDDSVLRHLIKEGVQKKLFKPSPFHSGMLPIHLAAANKHSESLKSLYPV